MFRGYGKHEKSMLNPSCSCIHRLVSNGLLAGTFFVGLVAVSCAPSDDAASRLRAWFGVTDTRSTAGIQAQLSAIFPPGTAKSNLLQRLHAAMGSQSSGASVSELQHPNRVFLRTGGATIAAVRDEYAITFFLTTDERVSHIAVAAWATGL